VEKEITSKSLKTNKTLIYSTLIELALQMAFFHWNIHGKKSYIYTIQNAILSICLFEITSPIRDALTFSIFRAICSTHLNLRYESLVYRLLSMKSIFFKLDMMSNIIKFLDVVIVGKVNTHVFLIAWQRADNNLDLLFISRLMPNTP